MILPRLGALHVAHGFFGTKYATKSEWPLPHPSQPRGLLTAGTANEEEHNYIVPNGHTQ